MIKYEDLNYKLILESFPELREKVDKQVLRWGTEEIPNHCLYGDTFCTYSCELLAQYEDMEMIQRIFDFYEYLSSEGDEGVQNLVQVTLLEVLWDSSQIYKRAVTFMGPHTKRINSEIAEYLREPK